MYMHMEIVNNSRMCGTKERTTKMKSVIKSMKQELIS